MWRIVAVNCHNFMTFVARFASDAVVCVGVYIYIFIYIYIYSRDVFSDAHFNLNLLATVHKRCKIGLIGFKFFYIPFAEII